MAETPMMRQYNAAKSKSEGALLFFRMGDFYELFFDDAKVASQALGITLTSRSKEQNIPMAGVPVRSAEGYLRRLVKQGGVTIDGFVSFQISVDFEILKREYCFWIR